MSKREGNPKMPENAPEAKKPKLEGETPVNPQPNEPAAPQQRPNSPVAGPSTAPSDPELQLSLHTGLIPIYRYFNPTLLQTEGSSQGSFTDIGATTSSTDTTSSTNVEVGDSRTSSLEDMDVDSDVPTSESSTSTDRRTRSSTRRYRKHRSRRDQ